MSSTPPTADQTASTKATRWFENEVHRYDASLRAYLHRFFPAEREVDDVVQESYLRIWKARAVSPIQSARAFLFTVARHVVLDLVRRRRISPIDVTVDFSAVPVTDHRPGTVATVCAQEEVEFLARAIDALPERCRAIVILRKLKGVPQKEIARQLGISEPTVQVQVARGMKRCDEYLREHGVKLDWR